MEKIRFVREFEMIFVRMKNEIREERKREKKGGKEREREDIEFYYLKLCHILLTDAKQ